MVLCARFTSSPVADKAEMLLDVPVINGKAAMSVWAGIAVAMAAVRDVLQKSRLFIVGYRDVSVTKVTKA